LKTLYRKRTVIWPFYFYTIIRTLSFKILKYILLNKIFVFYLKLYSIIKMIIIHIPYNILQIE
ncbi:sodium transporter, partial [Staphylococcus haemolyticus]